MSNEIKIDPSAGEQDPATLGILSGHYRLPILRVVAKSIDFFIALILSAIFYPVGVVLAFIYLSGLDFFQNGQMAGKRFVGIKAQSFTTKLTCTYKSSLIRNLPFLIPLFFMIIPFWGWIISLILGVPLTLLELYLLFTTPEGHRLGDVMADTEVINLPSTNRS